MKLICDEKLLRRKCENVSKEDTEIEIYIKKMAALLIRNQGSGIAAPQVGSYKRFFLIYDEIDKRFDIFINPELASISEEKVESKEGCLSIKKCWGTVVRSEEITIKYYDGNGYKEKTFKKKYAKRIQHELDHLDGILFIDKTIKKFKVSLYNRFCRLIKNKISTFHNRLILKSINKLQVNLNKL